MIRVKRMRGEEEVPGGRPGKAGMLGQGGANEVPLGSPGGVGAGPGVGGG